MWNRRKEEDLVLKPATAPPTPSTLAKEGIPMSTLPGRTSSDTHFDSALPRRIGCDRQVSSIVKGQIFSRRGSYHRRRSGRYGGAAGACTGLTVGPNGKGHG